VHQIAELAKPVLQPRGRNPNRVAQAIKHRSEQEPDLQQSAVDPVLVPRP